MVAVPTLVHGPDTIIESDHIARHVVATHDPEDRLRVRSEDVRDLNRLAVLNGVMDNEVVLILVRRGGFADTEGVAYFRKLASAIESGLAWLDAQTDPEREGFDHGDIVTVCMWQHVQHDKLVAGLARYERIAARVERLAARESVASTTPEASLAEATAAGWKPA